MYSASERAVSSLTVASSEHDAMMSSLNGFHLMSSTGPECPHTFGVLMSMRPVYNNTATVNTVLCNPNVQAYKVSQCYFMDVELSHNNNVSCGVSQVNIVKTLVNN